MDGHKNEVKPAQLLSVADGVFLTAGMIIGALIFKAPSTVAGATSGTADFLFAWVLGGLISLCGALVYAELKHLAHGQRVRRGRSAGRS